MMRTTGWYSLNWHILSLLRFGLFQLGAGGVIVQIPRQLESDSALSLLYTVDGTLFTFRRSVELL